MKTVWVYVDTRKEVGDIDHLKYSQLATLPRNGSKRTIR